MDGHRDEINQRKDADRVVESGVRLEELPQYSILQSGK